MISGVWRQLCSFFSQDGEETMHSSTMQRPSDADCYYWSHLNWWRFDVPNCAGQRRRYKGQLFCTLHYPGQDKDDFWEVLDEKLKKGDLDFRGAQFPNFGLPERAKIDTQANFLNADFSGNVRLRKVIFDKHANFSEATFLGAANFHGTTFVEGADFSKALFRRGADFSEATFREKVAFSLADFRGDANFAEASFWGESSFLETTFHEDVSFNRSRFMDHVRFYGGVETRVFNARKRVDFQYAQVYEPSNFSVHTAVLRPSWLVNVAGISKFSFTNVKWDYSLKEEKASVAALNTGVSHRRVPSKDTYHILGQVYKDLAANAEQDNLYSDANNFSYWSMQAFRKSSWLSYLNPITFLHWALSGYGNRPLRAFCALLLIYLTFALVFLCTGSAQDKNCGFEPLSLWQALQYSLGAITLQVSPDCVTRLPAFFIFLEGTLGPIQLALLALALRRKFMR
jgi:hypothetical protein